MGVIVMGVGRGWLGLGRYLGWGFGLRLGTQLGKFPGQGI